MKKFRTKTIVRLLKEKSNDYTVIEKKFNLITGKSLLAPRSFLDKKSKFRAGVSVIIPTYNSNGSLSFVLQAINEAAKTNKRIKIECIVVDDGSDQTPEEIIKHYKKNISIKLLANSKNYGAALCRSRGVEIAENETIIFLDSDTVPSSDFFFNHAFVQENLPKDKVILASFRENVLPCDPRLSRRLIANKDIETSRDFRRVVKIKAEWTRDNSLKNKKLHILKETNNWKNFGNLKKHGIWTLPMMSLTCALSCRKSMLTSINFHPEWFSGWGFDDIAMGATLIAGGAFLVPNFNSAVLHIAHSPRSGSAKDKISDFSKNRKKYNKLLKSEM